MQRNQRDAIVATAQAQLAISVANLVESHHLTYGEIHRILNDVAGNWIKYQLRDEREPNPKLRVVRGPKTED